MCSIHGVTTPADPLPQDLPQDLASAHAMILAQREALMLAQSETQVGRLEIERLKLMLAKLRREQFGQSSERGKLLIEQLELAIEDLEESRAAEEAKAEAMAPAAAKVEVQDFTSLVRPSRKRLSANPVAGRSSSMCGRNFLAGIVKQSANRRRPRMPFRAVLPGRACSP